MKAYKLFNNDWTCNGFKFEIGKEYVYEGKLHICRTGFHACERLEDCFKFYLCVPWNKIAEVELLGEIISHPEDSKKCTNKIKIVKEIKFNDIKNIIESKGVARSEGVAWSKGVVGSEGVVGSKGVARSKGVVGSFAVKNSSGISAGLFVDSYHNNYLLFNKPVSEARFQEVNNKLLKILNGWAPTYNNLKSLFIKSGKDWKSTPITDAKIIQKEEAWVGIPLKAIKYLKSLEEYDETIFHEITGL